MVPFGRNKGFVGRGSVLEQLLATVPPEKEKDDCQRTAIEGIGGIGKTQIALETAYRVRDKYPNCSVFWVPAVDVTTFENAYRDIGRKLNVDGVDDDKADVKTLVNAALARESAGSWLLVIDNADDAGLFGDTSLTEYLPFSVKGSILVTTRNHEVVVGMDIAATNTILVEGMSKDEALNFLNTNLQERQMNNMEHTAELLELLAYLPLALKQASAFMAKKNLSTTKYLDICRSSDKEMANLLSENFEDRHRYTAYKEIQNPVATTWLISFRHVSDHDQLAADYLKFMCLLSEKDIPLSILPPAEGLAKAKAIGTLKSFAFISEHETPDAYDVHRLVRLAMFNWLKEKGHLNEWTITVLKRLGDVFPYPKHENRGIWVRYLPHTRRVLDDQGIADNDKGKQNLLSVVAAGFNILGQYEEAEAMHRRAYKGYEKVLGPEHPYTLTSVNNLGLVLQSQGKYEEAEAMHRRALKSREKVPGPEHPDTLTSVSHLGSVLQSQGKYKEAEAIRQRHLNEASNIFVGRSSLGPSKSRGRVKPRIVPAIGKYFSRSLR